MKYSLLAADLSLEFRVKCTATLFDDTNGPKLAAAWPAFTISFLRASMSLLMSLTPACYVCIFIGNIMAVNKSEQH